LWFVNLILGAMAPEEAAAITRLSRVCLALLVGSQVIVASNISVVVLWEGHQTSDFALSLVSIGLALLSGSIAALTFWSKGGCESHHTYLSFLLPVLYVFTLLVLYLSVKLGIFLGLGLEKKVGENATLFLAACIIYWLAAISIIVATLRLPRLVSFLRDFRKLPRSRDIQLSQCLFLSHWSKLDEIDQDEVNAL
jgi:hypothetical protein